MSGIWPRDCKLAAIHRRRSEPPPGETPWPAVIVAPSSTDNSLGRALTLADVFAEVGEVRVMAYDTGTAWTGAGSWRHEVVGFRRLGEVRRMLNSLGGPGFVVTTKPLPSSLGFGLLAIGAERRWRLVMDIDEDDVELRRATLRHLDGGNARRRAWMMWRRPAIGHPTAVRALGAVGARTAALVTASSRALAVEEAASARAVEVVPHARPARSYTPPSQGGARLRFGFLGTLRSYKGVDALRSVLEHVADSELHVMAGSSAEALDHLREQGRVVEHEQRGPGTLTEAYRQVDVVLLPQDPTAPQTKLQLPAKLVDALMFGRPILATPTPPVTEIACGHAAFIRDWSNADELRSAVSALRDPAVRDRLGRAANSHAVEHLSCGAIARRLASNLHRIAAP